MTLDTRLRICTDETVHMLNFMMTVLTVCLFISVRDCVLGFYDYCFDIFCDCITRQISGYDLDIAKLMC